MALKETTFTVTAEGRDIGKTFVITEMPAMKAERWAIRVFLALARSGVDVPDDVVQSGMAGMVSLTLRSLAGVRYEDADPLLTEMMGCVTYRPDPSNPAIKDRRLVDNDIEEVMTILKLRDAILELHTGFSLAAIPSMFPSPSMAADISDTPTSPGL